MPRQEVQPVTPSNHEAQSETLPKKGAWKPTPNFKLQGKPASRLLSRHSLHFHLMVEHNLRSFLTMKPCLQPHLNPESSQWHRLAEDHIPRFYLARSNCRARSTALPNLEIQPVALSCQVTQSATRLTRSENCQPKILILSQSVIQK